MNRFSDSEQDRALRVAADFLQDAGFTLAPDCMRMMADGDLTKFVEKAVEAGVAGAKERIELECECKLATARLRMQQEYEFALMMKGSGVGGWNTQGEYTVW